MSTPSLQDLIRLVETQSHDHEPLHQLQTASTLVRDLASVGDAALGYFVDQARHAGHSWAEIGEALGVTKQAAQQKHTVRPLPGLEASMTAQFTPRARRVVRTAEPIARERAAAEVGPEHLLLSLYREPKGVAAQLLAEAGLAEDAAKLALALRVGEGPGSPAGSLPYGVQARAVIDALPAVAEELGHSFVGTEHLLLELASVDGPVREVLAGADLTRLSIGAKIADLLARD